MISCLSFSFSLLESLSLFLSVSVSSSSEELSSSSLSFLEVDFSLEAVSGVGDGVAGFVMVTVTCLRSERMNAPEASTTLSNASPDAAFASN